MLKQRLLTALVLIPLVVTGILELSTYHLSLLLTAVLVAASWEWSALMGLRGTLGRMIYALAQGSLLPFSMQLFEWSPIIVLGAAMLWWFVAMFWIGNSDGQVAESRAMEIFVHGVAGILVLQPMWIALVDLHSNGVFGAQLLLYLMVIVWGADSSAYLAGRLWGKARLAVQISPGKTWEGVYGAVAATIVIASLGVWWFGFKGTMIVAFVLLSVATVMFSIVGDLWESLLKRRRGLKDSGQILPGHGGIMDRIDSLTAAAPIFCLGMMLQGLIQ